MPSADRRQLAEFFATPAFDPGFFGDERDLAAPYRRMRHVHAHLTAPAPLLAHDRRYLRDLLELAAIVDPRLFHLMFLNHCMATGGVLEYAADPAVLAEVTDGFTVGTALMTELGHGNSSANILTEAVYDSERDEFVLSTPAPEATKFPPNLGLDGWARWGVVSARLKIGAQDHGLFLFLVPMRTESGLCPGVRIRPLPDTALLPMDYAAVAFDRVRVPRRFWLSDGAQLGPDGAWTDPAGGPAERSRRSAALARFAWGALSPGMAAMARSAAAIALTHARRRVITNRYAANVPAVAYRGQQRLLASALAAAFAATAVARDADTVCWRLSADDPAGAGAPGPAEMRAASLAKVAVDRLAQRAITSAQATCGALGFMSVNRLVDYLGFTLAFTSAGGDNQVILLDGAWSMANGQDYQPPQVQVRVQIQVQVREASDTAAEPDKSAEPAKSAEFYVDLLRLREAQLHARLRDRLQLQPADHAARNETADPFTVWNDQAALAQEFAEAHLDRITGEAMGTDITAAAELADPADLADLRLFLTLEAVDRHSGWYQSRGLLTADQADRIAEHISDCCDRICAAFDTLLPALGIPVNLTRSAIAGPSYISTLAPS